MFSITHRSVGIEVDARVPRQLRVLESRVRKCEKALVGIHHAHTAALPTHQRSINRAGNTVSYTFLSVPANHKVICNIQYVGTHHYEVRKRLERRLTGALLTRRLALQLFAGCLALLAQASRAIHRRRMVNAV